MKLSKKEIFYAIIGVILSLIQTNVGFLLLRDFPERPLLGIATIIFAFLSLYLFSYIFQIRENQKKIEELEKEVERIKTEKEVDEKLLNTIKDIVILDKSKRLK